jgi:S-adenosylmethionine hydrolase
MHDGWLITHALYVDRFGNVQLDAQHGDLEESGLRLGRAVTIRDSSGQSHTCPFVRTFADAELGGLLLYEDAHQRLAVAVSQGDAARRLGIHIDDELWITPA